MPNIESNDGGGVLSDNDTNGTPDDEDQSADEEGCINEHMQRDTIGQTAGADEEGPSVEGDGSCNAGEQKG